MSLNKVLDKGNYMIGCKSIVVELVINNVTNPEKPYEILVRANKNLGICDIIRGIRVPQEVVDLKTKKKRTILKFLEAGRVPEVLSDFQGQQINSSDTISELKSALYTTLNEK